jgi:hypothetical protein
MSYYWRRKKPSYEKVDLEMGSCHNAIDLTIKRLWDKLLDRTVEIVIDNSLYPGVGVSGGIPGLFLG